MDNNANIEKKKRSGGYIGALWLAIGEVIVSAIVIAVFLIVQQFVEADIFNYTLFTGALLGSAVTVANFLVLSVSVNRAIDKFMNERGDGEMDEEQIAEFTSKNAMAVQAAATKSYILRMVSMVVCLVVALLTPWFNVIPTVVPLLMFKPILYATEFIRKKRATK